MVEVLERNGFRCPAGARDQVVGFQIVDTLTTVDSRCPRVDKVFCEETIVGEYGRYRMDLDSTECFPPQTARSLKKMARAIERGGVHCQRARDSISGVLLEKSGACYRPQAVYCNRPY